MDETTPPPAPQVGLLPPVVPADPLFGLAAEVARFSGPRKVNLGPGIYFDDSGATPPFASIATAGRQAQPASAPARYLPILGHPGFREAAQALLVGEGGRADGVVSAQTLGGTGALALAARLVGGGTDSPPTVWLSDPTWANHRPVFETAGLRVETYPYYDRTHARLARDALFEHLEGLGPRDVVLLHACGHNPTGVDLSIDDWHRVAQAAGRRGFLPLIDAAYPGLCAGLEEDLEGTRALLGAGIPAIVAFSFSKIMGLYAERVGALHVFGSPDPGRVSGWLEAQARRIYSNPPRTGAMLCHAVLTEADARARWLDELEEARKRIARMREQLADEIRRNGGRPIDRLRAPGGLFALSGLSPEEVESVKKLGVFLPRSGRINCAAITPSNVGFVAEALTPYMR